jgi:hypothetical protein
VVFSSARLVQGGGNHESGVDIVESLVDLKQSNMSRRSIVGQCIGCLSDETWSGDTRSKCIGWSRSQCQDTMYISVTSAS